MIRKISLFIFLLVFAIFFVMCSGDDSESSPKVITYEINEKLIEIPDQDTIIIKLNDVLKDEYKKTDVYSLEPALKISEVKYAEIESDLNPDIPKITTIEITLGESIIVGKDYTLKISQLANIKNYEQKICGPDEHVFYQNSKASNKFEKSTGKLKAVGEKCVVYVWKENFDSVSEKDAKEIADEFDNRIYDIATMYYGEPTDVDNNGKIIIYITYMSIASGYFYKPDLYDEETVKILFNTEYTNKMEMLYLNIEKSPYSIKHLILHEFSHLINEHYAIKRLEKFTGTVTPSGVYNLYLPTWLNEGMATNAEKIGYGHKAAESYYVTYQLDTNEYIRNGYSLVFWSSVVEDYALTYLFNLYVYRQTDDIKNTFKDINLLENYNRETLDKYYKDHFNRTFDELFRDWLIATHLMKDEGVYSYNDSTIDNFLMMNNSVRKGNTSIDLMQYGRLYFKYNETAINYPSNVGTNIRYIGINSAKEVDFEAPFNVENGTLICYNINHNIDKVIKEKSGPDIVCSSYNGINRSSFSKNQINKMFEKFIYFKENMPYEQIAIKKDNK